MRILNILAGPAGVGKSTFIKDNKKEEDVVVSSDAIRIELFGGLEEGNKNNNKVFQEAHSRILKNLKEGKTVFFDATNISRKSRIPVYNLAKSVGAKVVVNILHRPLDVILKQNNQRKGDERVPENVVRQMYLNFQPPKIGLDADEIKVYAPDFEEYEEELNFRINEPHNSPYHEETIKEHIELTIKNAKGNKELVEVAKFHDRGKTIARSKVRPSNLGELYLGYVYGEFDRYIGHQNLSAIYYLVEHKNNFDETILDVIFHHMEAHKGFSEKYIAKHKMSKEVIELALEFAKIDEVSRVVKPEILEKFAEYKEVSKGTLLNEAIKSKEVIVLANWEKELFSIKYLHASVDFSNKLNINARGLVLDKTGNIVTIGFEKFFNYKQLEVPEFYQNIYTKEFIEERCNLLGTTTYQAKEKLDGTFITIGTRDGEIVAATTGSTLSGYSTQAENYFNNNKNLIKFLEEKNLCLFFEFTSPKNRIIVPYKEEKYSLIGGRPRDLDAKILTFEELEEIAKTFTFEMPKVVELTLDELKTYQKENKETEGFVVVNEYGNLVKLKTDYWFEQSDNLGGIFFGNPYAKDKLKKYIEIYLADEFDDFIAYRNQNYVNGLHQHLDLVYSWLKEFTSNLEILVENYQNHTDKEVGLANIEGKFLGALFAIRKTGHLEEKHYLNYLKLMVKELEEE